jgi:hypothetical protein
MALTKLSTDVIDLSGNTEALTIPSGTTSNSNLDSVDWLVVAGGAGGGSNGGGGGAGGLRTSYGSTAPGTTGTIESALSLTHSVAYTATVGAGGAALIMAAGYQLQGNAGGASSLSGTGITTITTDGGGGGASNNVAAANGGSGGGSGSPATTPGSGNTAQGHDGGTGGSAVHPYRGAGGGGADTAGSDHSSGNGGAGITVGITTGSDAYAGGGGGTGGTQGGAGGTGGLGGGGNGGVGSSGAAGTSGTANTGSGGGSSGDYGPTGAGGDGIIVLRYPSIFTATYALSSTTYNDCTYPVTNTAMYPFESNADNNSVCATSGSYNGTERGITYTAGKFNNAATYTGSNASTGSQIYISNSVWGGNTSTFSFSVWIKTNGPQTVSAEIPIVGNGGTIGSTTGFAIYMTGGTLNGTLCSTALGTGQEFFPAAADLKAIDDSAWHHVAFTFDDSSGAYVLYLDGASYASGTSSTAFRGDPTPTYDTYVGNRWNRNENGVFPGQIDQLRIFANTVLTGTQVTNLYNEVGGVANAEVTDGTDKYIQILGGTGTITFSNSATTTGRPTSPAEGLLRDNTTTGALEFYNGSSWQQIAGTLVPDFQASSYFNTVIYNGNGSSQSIDNGLNLSSDGGLVWIKDRLATGEWHALTDSIRGTNSQLFSNAGNAQDTKSTVVTAFNTGGFSVGSDNLVNRTLSGSNGSYVSWSWKTGGIPTASSSGTSQTPTANSKMVDGVSNTSNWATTTNGYPTTQSVNTTAGFSITAFTKASTGNPCTVPHSLGATPEFIISKIYNTAEDWVVWHKDIGNDYYLSFNRNGGTDGKTSSSYTFTTVDSNIIESQWTNAVQNWIFYAWTSISGFSKFDKYTGSGVSGHAIATGFSVGFLIIKSTGVESWYVFDNKRKTGVYSDQLSLNTANAEATGTYVELTSTGFTLHTTASGLNNSGVEFIYIAFAS